ncbi:hypothetical protein [Nocardioides alcanivorans]|uniref:hypothetical protein n=1 Tax=Nocardioides alcanivorans TaxID=2897352 RepID=UPI001F3A9F8E|nr:hypothetical protein [Nocardioides alcanivorans]
MSRQFPRSTAVVAGLTGAVVLAALLGWGAIGGDDEDAGAKGSENSATSDEPGDRTEPEELPELEEGFTAIPAAELLPTIAEAQQNAKSWTVTLDGESAGTPTPQALQEIQFTDTGATFRIQMAVTNDLATESVVEGLYVDETFYLKGFNPKKWDQAWYQLPNDDQLLASFESMLQGATASNLMKLGEPSEYEVVGIEDVQELDDDVVRAVHYKLTVDPSAAMGAQGVTEDMQYLDIWVDAENRPVQVNSLITSGGDDYRSTLFYSEYGKDFGLVAPAKKDVTDRRPPAMKAAESPEAQ